MLSRPASRFLLAAASMTILAFALTLSPTGVSVAEGCSGSAPSYMCSPTLLVTSAALVTDAASVPREGVLLELSATDTLCPGNVSAVARAPDGSAVAGTLSVALSVIAPPPNYRWVALWKADASLDPNTNYTLEVSSVAGGAAGGSGGNGSGGAPFKVALPFTTASESASLALPTVSASIAPKTRVSTRICCTAPDDNNWCVPQATCVDASTSDVPELTASFVVAASPLAAPYHRYFLTTQRQTQSGVLEETVQTFNGWDVHGMASMKRELQNGHDYCVSVATMLTLTGQTETSVVCPATVNVDPAKKTKCAETADLIAKCPTLYSKPTTITGFPDLFFQAECSGGAGNSGAAGAAPGATGVQAADEGGCNVASGARTGAAAGWMFLFVGLAASRRRRSTQDAR